MSLFEYLPKIYWDWVNGNLIVEMVFDKKIDTTLSPNVSGLVADVYTEAVECSSFGFNDDYSLELYFPLATRPSIVFLNLDAIDPQLRFKNGKILDRFYHRLAFNHN